MSTTCPKCGAQNDETSKFCFECGTPLDASTPEEPKDETPEAEVKTENVAPETGAQPAPEANSQPTQDEPESSSVNDKASEPESEPSPASEQLSDVAAEVKTDTTEALAGAEAAAKETAEKAGKAASEAAGAAKEKAAAAKGKFDALPSKTKGIIGGAAVAVVALIITAVMLLNGGPSDGDIENMVRNQLTPGAFSGTYVNETPYEVSAVKILSKEKGSLTAEEKQALGYFGISLDSNDYYECQIEVDLTNDLAETVKTGEVSVVKYQGEWGLSTNPSFSNSSTTAKAGVDSGKVIENIDTILYQASSGMSDSLSYLYKDGTFEVASENFDESAQTDTLEITCKKETDYSELTGTITAVFTLQDGSWKLTSAQGSDGIDKASYQKLVGTWTGKFFETRYAFGGKCYGAESKEAKVVINSVDDNSLKVEGTFTVLAHYHDKSSSDANSTDGDTVLSEEPFTMTLEYGHWDSGTGGSEYGGLYSRAQDSNGSVSVNLAFGTYSSSYNGDVVLTVETHPSANQYGSYQYYTDVYTLTKSE